VKSILSLRINKKKLSAMIFITIVLLLIPIVTLSDGEDNAGSGVGGTGSGVDGKGFYRSGEWMYKVSVYIGLKDTANTNSSFYFDYTNIGNPVFVKPSSFALPNGVIFGKHSKVNYLRGSTLESVDNPKIITDKAPPIPITHGGNLQDVKNYFGDINTLRHILDAIAQQQGTSREGLVSNIEFDIDGEKGIKDPKDILPIKGEDGKYSNKVPWVVIYEPVAIAHLKDKSTKLAFTATEFALAQRDGLFDFFYSGPNAQYIAGMTHANLPNSIVLEHDWFGYTTHSPTAPKVKWSNERIIKGGGWGMRFLKANGSDVKPPIDPPEPTDPKLDKGDYRVDTDVITSFEVGTDLRITPDKPTTILFYVNGRLISEMDIVLPEGGSQLVWAKWHTPSTPQTMRISAEIKGGGYFIGSDSKTVKIVDLEENVPPDPRAKDFTTGKVIEKPKGWKIPNLPNKASKTTATWGEWSAYWEEDWQWVEDWKWVKNREWDGEKWVDNGGEWVDKGKWVDFGDWEYFWNSYSASINSNYRIKPDEKVPTAKQIYNRYEMKSGYGLNIEVDTRVISDAPNSAIATQGNVINYFPEFNYDTYCRLSDRIGSGKFQLKKNKYSTFNQRVHFTPLWYPDNKYTLYSEALDLWTPAGMLTIGLDDYIDIKGSVLDDWKVVPAKP
jgi:hypothetical protein